MRKLILTLLVLSPVSVYAQIGTEPLAVPSQYRSLVDKLGTVAVAAQAAEVIREDAQDWRAGNHVTTWQSVCSVGSAMLITEAAKRAIGEERPDGSDNLSNPSGHSAFSASLYSRKHPLMSVTFTVTIGLSRSMANKHHLWGPRYAKDIPIGWLIGTLTNVACHEIISTIH